MVLPGSVVAQMRSITGAFVTSNNEYTAINCSMRDSEGYFTFGLGGSDALKVNVSMRSLVIPAPKKDQAYFNSIGENLCEFAVYEAELYDTGSIAHHLLRSVYTVVDMENRKLAMAPIKLDAKNDQSNVVAFDDLTQFATLALNQPSAMSLIGTSHPPLPTSWHAVEGFKVLNPMVTVAATSLSSPSLPSPSSSGTSSPGIASGNSNTRTKAGVAVGVSIAIITLVVGTFFTWRRWKGKRELAHKLLIEQQLRSEKPELHGKPMSIYEARGLRDSKGNIIVSEMPGDLEPAELYVVENCVELPATPVVPRDETTELPIDRSR